MTSQGGRGSRSKVTTPKTLPGVEAIADAVGTLLEGKFAELKNTVVNLSNKVEETAGALVVLQNRFDVATANNVNEVRNNVVDMDKIRQDISLTLGNVAAEVKSSFEQTLQGRSKATIEAGSASFGTTSQVEDAPYVTIIWEDRETPIYFPSSVRESLAVQTIVRGVVRVVLRHFHQITEIRMFTLKGSTEEESNVEDSADELEATDDPPKMSVPAKTLLVATGVAQQRFAPSAAIKVNDPVAYARMMENLRREVRGSASRVFQYFRTRYDKNGNRRILPRKPPQTGLRGKKTQCTSSTPQ